MNIWHWDRTYVFLAIASVFALAASLYLSFGPFYFDRVVTGTNETADFTLIEVEGVRVAVILAIPLLLCAVALAVVPRRGDTDRRHKINLWAAIFGLVLFTLISINSIGLFYVPAMTFMFSAGTVTTFRRRRPAVENVAPVPSPRARPSQRRSRRRRRR